MIGMKIPANSWRTGPSVLSGPVASSSFMRCRLSEAKDGPLAVACFSVSMLLHEKGKQYTARELHDMLSRAGFIDFQSAPTFGYYHLVQAARP